MARMMAMRRRGWSARGVLLGALLLAGLGWSAGCARRAAPLRVGAYRLQTLPDVTLLLAPGLTDQPGASQTTAVTLGSPSRLGVDGGGEGCAIAGPIFGLRPPAVAPADAAHASERWEVVSPSVNGWKTDAIQAQADEAWSGFTRQLEALVAKGCFPAGMSTYAVHRRIAEAIPMPADKVLRYFYSLTSAGFVDLQPGMQLGIETVTDRMQAKSDMARLSVVDRPPLGVSLETMVTGEAAGKATATLLPRYAAMPFLRLFLQRAATGTEEARDAMLLGGATAAALDAATAEVLQKGAAGCAGDRVEGTLCTVFAGSGVSLLTAVTVNGRPAFYAPGTTLSQIVDALSEVQRAKAAATVSMERSSAAGYVPVEVPRTEEGRFNVLLLTGDRVRWRR